jgi:putative tricarboxylic transport membrane protein
MNVPVAPVIIGFILGKPLEEALGQTLLGSEGSLRAFFQRPIPLVFMALAGMAIMALAWGKVRKKLV